MSRTIDYYFATQSPWTYLGHWRFAQIAAAAGATVRVKPIDLGAVFPLTGGLPLAKRAPQRLAYRLLELRRFSEHLNAPLHLEPQFFPVAGDDAAKLILAVAMHEGAEAAMAISGAVLRAVWAEQRNIANESVLSALLAEQGLPARRLEDAHSQAANERYEAATAQALAAGVFGAPTYAIAGELFWGQDRLGFVERRLAKG